MRLKIILLCLIIFSQTMYGKTIETPDSKKLSLGIDLGLGNLSTIYLLYGSKEFKLGLGCGYLYHTDSSLDLSINVISPCLTFNLVFWDLFILRQRVGVDFVGLKGKKLNFTNYLLSLDFLVKLARFKESYLAGGFGMPILFGRGGMDFDTVIGISYVVDF